jgi:hypothetical protein
MGNPWALLAPRSSRRHSTTKAFLTGAKLSLTAASRPPRRADGRPIAKQLQAPDARWSPSTSIGAGGWGERLFAWLQNYRRLVVRYEHYADNFLGMVLGDAQLSFTESTRLSTFA